MSESEHPYCPVGQFFRIRAGHLWRQTGSILTNWSLNVSKGSYGSRFQSYGNILATLFTHFPTVWTAKRSAVGIRVLAVYWRWLQEHVTQNPCSLIFSLPIGGEIL